MEYTVLRYETLDSTNRFLREYIPPQGEKMTVAVCSYQTNGRGQGSNRWESEAGKNLLFSILTHPRTVPARQQFVLSMAEALAQKDALDTYTGGIPLKWPNDVYWNDMKIAGTLIETRISGGMVTDCITGTGINVNQRHFSGDAPNPVSLLNVTGREADLSRLLETVMDAFCKYYDMACRGGYDYISKRYHEALYRRTGVYEYEDSGGRFLAEIVRVEATGRIVLRRSGGDIRGYAFKEVRFVI